jgi:hypothetical protein
METAGTEPTTPTAELGGITATDTGTEPDITSPAEGECAATEETTDSTEETQEWSTEEAQPTGKRQVTFEERVAEVAEKKAAALVEEKMNEFLAKAEQERTARTQAEYAPAEVEEQVKTNIARNTIAMRNLEQEMDLAGVDTAEGRELLNQYYGLREGVGNAETALADNQQKRMAHEVQAKQTAQEQQFFQKMQGEIDTVSELKRQSLNLTPEVWAEGRKMFAQECKADPMVQRTFDDLVRISPAMAVNNASDRMEKSMAEKAKAIQTKNTAKEKTFSGAEGGTATTTNFDKVRNFDDLQKLHSREINQFAKEHPKRFADLKARRFR